MDFKTIKSLVAKIIQDGKGILTLSRTDINNPEYGTLFDLLKTDKLVFAVSPTSAAAVADASGTLTLSSVDNAANTSFFGFNAPGAGGMTLTITDKAGAVDFSLTAALSNVETSKLVKAMRDSAYIQKGRLEDIAQIVNPTFKAIRMTVSGHSKTLAMEEDAAVPHAWNVLSSIGIDIQEVGLGVEYTLGQNFRLFFSTKTQVGTIPVDIRLLAPTGPFDVPDNWKLCITNRIQVDSLVDALSGFIAKASPATKDFPCLFPDAIRRMSFGIDDFFVLFHPAAANVSYISLAIDSENKWGIVPNQFTVLDLGMRIDINFVGASSIRIALHGLLMMGKYDAINVSMNVSSDTNADWELNLDASIDLDGIADLGGLPINTPVSDIALPDGFLTLSNLYFPLFKVAFNPFKATVAAINMAMSATMHCDLIPGILEIRDPSIGLDITNPFGPSRTIAGTVQTGVDIAGVGFDVAAEKGAEGWTFTGTSVSGNIDIKKIVDHFLPKAYELPPVFALTIPALSWQYLSERFTFSTAVDFDFGFGPEKTAVNFVHTTADGLSQYAFTIDFPVDAEHVFELEVDYTQRGTVLKGQLKSIAGKGIRLNMDTVLKRFGTSMKAISMPHVGAITLDSAAMAIDLGNKQFRLEGVFDKTLDVVLAAGKGASGWGFALGVQYADDIDLGALFGGGSLPGFVELRDLFIAFSSVDHAVNFSTANRQVPTMQLKKDSFSLGGAIEVKDKPLGFISGMADMQEDLFINGSIDLANQVLDLKVALTVKKDSPGIAPKNYPSIPMAGLMLELTLLEDDFLLSLAGNMTVSLYNTTVNMDGRVTFEENQFEISATLSGDPVKIPLALGLQFEFTDLAFELGDSYELEEPLAGFCGNVTFANFNAFMALMVDSGEPQNCLFVLSMNELPALALFDALFDLCTSHSKSLGFLDALKEIRFTGTDKGKIPYTDAVARELDSGKKCPEAAKLLDIGDYYITKGEKHANEWFITDRSNVRTYTVTKLGNQLDVTNEITIYIVPGATYYIGTKQFPQGFRFNGRLEIFSFSLEADMEVSAMGISIEADCSPLNLGNGIVRFVSTADNAKGPRLSLDTIKSPHFYLDGKLSFLGLSDAVHADISSSGLTIKMSTQLPFFKSSLNVTTNKWESLTLGSSVALSVSADIPTIKVGHITVLPTVHASLDFSAAVTVGIGIHDCSTTFSGELQWSGRKIFTLKNLKIAVDDFRHLEQALVRWIEKEADTIFAVFKKDVHLFLDFVKNKIIDLGNDVAKAMRYVFSYSDASKIAAEIKGIFDPDNIARNLHLADFANPQIATAMYHEVSKDAKAVGRIFKDVLGVTDGKVVNTLLTGAGFSNVESAIDSLFGCACYLKVSCVAHCPADCPVKVKCPTDCPAHCPGHCVADCPAHCVAKCVVHCPADCPTHCVADCPAHCVADCPLHCPVKLCAKLCVHL